MRKITYISIYTFFFCFISCTQTPKDNLPERPIIIHELNDAATLNPVTAGDVLSNYLGMHLFQSLISIDYETNDIVGVIANAPPTSTIDSLGQLIINYTIRPEAEFDNGRKITAEDILFSIKLNICPIVNNGNGKYYYGFIKQVFYNDDSPENFTIVCNNNALLNLFRSGDFAILPKEMYDPDNVLVNYSIDDLLYNEKLSTDSVIIKFASFFNQLASSSNASDFIGSGPYKLHKWQKDERIILHAKANWWGKKLEQEHTYFKQHAKKLQFEIINDPVTATTALKNGEVDLMRSIPAIDFDRLKSSENLQLASVSRYSNLYIGFNLNNQLLNQKAIRKSIESALPLDNIINTVFKGEAIKNRLPVALQQESSRNDTISFNSYDLTYSKKILEDANWADTDNDGILDKTIDGKKQSLELSYHYNTGNEARKSIGFILKNELKKIGIQVEVIGLEWTTYLQKLKNGELEVFINGISSPPLPPDFTNLFHSKSANGGRNYANYQNKEVDTLIDLMNIELNPDKRKDLTFRFQEIIAEEAPYLFLLTKKERVAYSKKLKNVNIYSLRPHFWAPEIHY